MVSYPVKGHSFRNPVEVLTDTSRKEWEQALSLEPNGFHCGFHCEIHSELQWNLQISSKIRRVQLKTNTGKGGGRYWSFVINERPKEDKEIKLTCRPWAFPGYLLCQWQRLENSPHVSVARIVLHVLAEWWEHWSGLGNKQTNKYRSKQK